MATKKPFYSIGQVADYFRLPQSVLRYWETVFDALNPAKSEGGNRQYSDEDLKIIQEIKYLLYEKGFTIKGANKLLNQKYGIKMNASAEGKQNEDEVEKENKENTSSEKGNTNLQHIVKELKEILKLLED